MRHGYGNRGKAFEESIGGQSLKTISKSFSIGTITLAESLLYSSALRAEDTSRCHGKFGNMG